MPVVWSLVNEARIIRRALEFDWENSVAIPSAFCELLMKVEIPTEFLGGEANFGGHVASRR